MYKLELKEVLELISRNCDKVYCSNCALRQAEDDLGCTCVLEGQPFGWDIEKVMQGIDNLRCERKLADLEEEE